MSVINEWTDKFMKLNVSKYKTNALCAAAIVMSLSSVSAMAEMTFRNAVTGQKIDFSFGKKGEETEAVKHFMVTGENLYNSDEAVIRAGEDLFATACSGCHGHHAEGKLGPALGDDYWTYPGAQTDKGLFEVIYDGARAMMGPQRNNLTIDEMLTVMSFLRSIYWGAPEKAKWLTEEQRASFEPAEMPAEFKEALEKFNESNGN
jgi:cytochrome c-L